MHHLVAGSERDAMAVDAGFARIQHRLELLVEVDGSGLAPVHGG